MSKSIAERVISAAHDYSGHSESNIKPESNLFDDLGMDSLDVTEFVMDVEEKFEMDIPDEFAEKFQTVQNVIDYVTAHLKQR